MSEDPFEHNLRLLLGRAYKPVRPNVMFARRLEQACAERAYTNRAEPRRVRKSPLRLVPLAAALAAAAALVWFARPIWRQADLAARSAGEILAVGDVALKSSLQEEWRSVPSGSSLVAAESTLAQVPEHGDLRVSWDKPVAHAQLGSDSAAQFGREDGLTVQQGAAQVTVGSSPFSLATERVRLTAQDAELQLSVRKQATTEEVAVLVLAGTVELDGGPRLEARKRPYDIVNGILSVFDPGAQDRVPVAGPEPGVGTPEDDRLSDTTDADSAELRLRVLDPLGSPKKEFRLWLRRQVNLPEVAEADAHEIVAADDDAVMDVEPGTYTIGVEAPGFAPILLRDQELAPGSNPLLEVSFEAGRPISGYIVDAETGAPVQDALVVIESLLPQEVLHAQGDDLDPVPHASGRTDAAGRWIIEHAPTGTQTIRASVQGHAPGRIPNVLIEPAAVDGSMQAMEQMELLRGAVLEGLVERLDGSTWAGTQLIASRIQVSGTGTPMTFGYAITGPDGRFRIEALPDGNYVVLLPEEMELGGPPRILHVRLTEGATESIHFPGAVSPAGGVQVCIQLRLANGQPAARINLTMTAVATGEWRSTSTDDEGIGQFVGIPPGAYDVALALGDGFDSLALSNVVEVTAQPQQTFEIRAGSVRIEGIAPGTTGGFVFLQQRQGDRWEAAGTAQIDRSGHWSMLGMRAGVVRGALFGRDASEGYAPIPETELVRDQVHRLDLPVEPGAELVVAVRDAAGLPVTDAVVALMNEAGLPLLYSEDPRTGADGTRELPIVPGGTWVVSATTADGRTARQERFFTAAESVELLLVLE